MKKAQFMTVGVVLLIATLGMIIVTTSNAPVVNFERNEIATNLFNNIVDKSERTITLSLNEDPNGTTLNKNFDEFYDSLKENCVLQNIECDFDMVKGEKEIKLDLKIKSDDFLLQDSIIKEIKKENIIVPTFQEKYIIYENTSIPLNTFSDIPTNITVDYSGKSFNVDKLLILPDFERKEINYYLTDGLVFESPETNFTLNVVITDEEGNKKIETVTIIVVKKLFLEAGQDITVKEGENFCLNAEANFEDRFIWNINNQTYEGKKICLSLESGLYEAVVSSKGLVDSLNIKVVKDLIPPVAVAGVGVVSSENLQYLNANLSYDLDGEIVSYEWDFGDGMKGFGKIINHSFSSGKHTVFLLVTDNDGLTDNDSITVEINEDSDGDNILDKFDDCVNTLKDGVPYDYLKPNNYADVDNDGIFEVNIGSSSKPLIVDSDFTLEQTRGCNCEQILTCKPGKDMGELKWGCSPGTMNVWIEKSGWSQDCNQEES